MGFPVYKPPLNQVSSSRASSPAPHRRPNGSSPPSRTSRQPPQLRRTETYLSPHAPIRNSPRVVRERRRRRQLNRQRHGIEPQIPGDLTATSFLASSFQLNTTPNMTTIPFSKPLFGTFPTLLVQPHSHTQDHNFPGTAGAMEIDGQPSPSSDIDGIPQDLFSVEWIYNNRELAMELLLGNFAGDESFADLLRLPTDMLSDHSSDESDIYEDDVDLDLDMEGTTEEVSDETSTERSLRGDILRGVDEDYD